MSNTDYPNYYDWPRITDLPEEEREPFSKWLMGQTVPLNDDDPRVEQDY